MSEPTPVTIRIMTADSGSSAKSQSIASPGGPPPSSMAGTHEARRFSM